LNTEPVFLLNIQELVICKMYAMSKVETKKVFSQELSQELLKTLESRFIRNMQRHEGFEWSKILSKLNSGSSVKKLLSLYEMEKTGGQPDVVGYEKESDEYVFYDCSPESPDGRRSLCYDREALESRKENKPQNSALDMAASMGIDLLTEEQYRTLQELGNFDTKTSSWVKTPDGIRKRGGALFCDRRYDHIFVYHNGAESYYAARGFRGLIKI